MRSVWLVGLVVSGCVSPPLHGSAGGGIGLGHVNIVDHRGISEVRDDAEILDLRAAITPFELSPEPSETVDFGLGWFVDRVDARNGQHGLYNGPWAELTWFTHVQKNEHERLRLGPTALAETTLGFSGSDALSVTGEGLSIGVLAEFVDRIDTPILLGRSRGHWGIGAAFRIGVRHFEGDTYATAILSLEVRSPGVAALPIPTPSRRRGLND